MSDKITKEHAKLYLDNQHLNNIIKRRKKHAKFLTVQNEQLKKKNKELEDKLEKIQEIIKEYRDDTAIRLIKELLENKK